MFLWEITKAKKENPRPKPPPFQFIPQGGPHSPLCGINTGPPHRQSPLRPEKERATQGDQSHAQPPPPFNLDSAVTIAAKTRRRRKDQAFRELTPPASIHFKSEHANCVHSPFLRLWRFFAALYYSSHSPVSRLPRQQTQHFLFSCFPYFYHLDENT